MYPSSGSVTGDVKIIILINEEEVWPLCPAGHTTLFPLIS